MGVNRGVASGGVGAWQIGACLWRVLQLVVQNLQKPCIGKRLPPPHDFLVQVSQATLPPYPNRRDQGARTRLELRVPLHQAPAASSMNQMGGKLPLGVSWIRDVLCTPHLRGLGHSETHLNFFWGVAL